MNFQELFDSLGLSTGTVNHLVNDVKLHNFQSPGSKLPEIDLTADIDILMVSVMPMIGRAVAKEKRRQFLDDEKKFTGVRN